MKRDALAGLIYDVLADSPEGLTMSEIAEAVDMPMSACNRATRTLRLILAEDDTLFVISEPHGQGQPWLYRLVDGRMLVDQGESTWAVNRIGDAQSRIHLLAVAMSTAVRATDGRTTEGKKAALMERVLRHLDEDLSALDHDE